MRMRMRMRRNGRMSGSGSNTIDGGRMRSASWCLKGGWFAHSFRSCAVSMAL